MAYTQLKILIEKKLIPNIDKTPDIKLSINKHSA